MPPKVLVVDDELAIREMVKFALSHAGLDHDTAANADQAEALIAHSAPDLVLLDWMLPGVSGVELARRLRGNPETEALPIIMLTARGEEEDKVRGLEVGADDYMTKPFSPKELIARIRAVLRRSTNRTQEALTIGGIELDPRSRRVRVDDSELDLSLTEFDLLNLLMCNPDRVYSRAQLLDLIWPHNVTVGERTVDVHISALRKVLKPLGRHTWIQTLRGAGYRFSPDN